MLLAEREARRADAREQALVIEKLSKRPGTAAFFLGICRERRAR